jgi:hypothetical protein
LNGHRDALARTTLLINREFFGDNADESLIADALLGSCVRLRADQQALETRAGQSALVTAFSMVARLGIGIELDVANVAVIDRVAPLRVPLLGDALLELGSDLVPGALIRTRRGKVAEAFAIGSPAVAPGEIVASVGDFDFSLERGSQAASCAGEQPFGGFAAGAALAAIALEAALPTIEAATGLETRTPRPYPGPPCRLDLTDLFPSLGSELDLQIAELDVISGGAITNALLFCMLRVPGLRTGLRVIEADAADLSNVNRYALLRASDNGLLKIDLLEAAATESLQIRGVNSLFTNENRPQLAPLTERVLVGVDDVEARWWVQEENPAWMAVGATGNHLAQLTTHIPGSPCAGCLHPVAMAPQEIPTISFVSFWAGLLQACALLSGESEPRNLSVFPFALGGTMPWASSAPGPSVQCPLRCESSTAFEREAA